MHQVVEVALWVVFIVACALVALGVATLARRRVVPARLRSPLTWRQQGWVNVLSGAFGLVETVPQLARATSGVVLACSLLAFVPMVAVSWISVSARRARALG